MLRDFRKDLGAPELPVIIGELGATDREAFHAAQAAVVEEPGMDKVTFVKTRVFWEPEVETMANEEVWKDADWWRFYNVGSNRGYHYLGSGKMMYSIGQAFGDAMLEAIAP